MRERVRCLKGTCPLESADNTSIKVEYVINEYEDRIPAGTHQNPAATIAGAHGFEGHLRSTANRYELKMSDTPYILHLKDGQKLKLYITRTDGQSADVKAAGGFF